MSTALEPEPAFVLHSRPYRETSALIDFFSRHYGRFRVVAKGVRSGKKNSRILAPYTPLLITWTGKSELKTLKHFESSGSPIILQGDRLYCGFYLNELLLRLLPEHDAHTDLFDQYLHVLTKLANSQIPMEPSLRTFEFNLLDDIGYGLVLDTDSETGDAIIAENSYWFDPLVGFTLKENLNACENINPSQKGTNLFSGKELLAIHSGHMETPEIASTAKRLMRLAFQPHIGNVPLKSRALFKK